MRLATCTRLCGSPPTCLGSGTVGMPPVADDVDFSPAVVDDVAVAFVPVPAAGFIPVCARTGSAMAAATRATTRAPAGLRRVGLVVVGSGGMFGPFMIRQLLSVA